MQSPAHCLNSLLPSKKNPTISSETGTVVTHCCNVISMFSSIHLSIGVFLRCNFFYVSLSLHCIILTVWCTFVAWFLIKYQYQYFVNNNNDNNCWHSRSSVGVNLVDDVMQVGCQMLFGALQYLLVAHGRCQSPGVAEWCSRAPFYQSVQLRVLEAEAALLDLGRRYDSVQWIWCCLLVVVVIHYRRSDAPPVLSVQLEMRSTKFSTCKFA